MVTVEAVKAWLRLPTDDATDDDLIGSCVEAVNVWVGASAYVTDLDPTDYPAGTWPDDVTLGGTMLAARLYRRRNTPGGIETFTDGAVYVPRRDSDVDSMLHLGAWAPPRVG